MQSIKSLLFIVIVLFAYGLRAQNVEVYGTVKGNEDVDGIHIINKTASKFTTTNVKGEFVLPVSLNDTIVVSGVRYEVEVIIVTQQILDAKTITVELTEKTEALEEVIVGKVLTGDLHSDIENSEVKSEINFTDLGIPGYTGRRFTQTERRFNEATTGGGIVPLNPLLNAISGRTKRLKKQIRLEKQEEYMYRAISEFSESLLEKNSIDEASIMEFFYFASEDDKFFNLSRINDPLQLYEFLQNKLLIYKQRLENN